MNGDFLFVSDRLLTIYENHDDEKCIMSLVANFSRLNKFRTPGQAHCVMLSDHFFLFFTVDGLANYLRFALYPGRRANAPNLSQSYGTGINSNGNSTGKVENSYLIFFQITRILVEITCIAPLIAIPFAYWLANSKEWVVYLVLLHMAVAVLLASVAVINTGSIRPGKMERFVRYSFRLPAITITASNPTSPSTPSLHHHLHYDTKIIIIIIITWP